MDFNHAITILVGAVVFVTAYTWRDFFQICIQKFEENFPNSLSPIWLSFLLAVILTFVSIVLINFTGYKMK